MAKKYVIGIDVGTSGCKSIIVDEAGEVISSSLDEYPLYTPHPGWAEQDPDDWWQATIDSLKDALHKSNIDTGLIKGIGLSAQMHGLVALDKDLNVIRPAILWNDQRTMKQCREIFDILGSQRELIKYTNNTMLPGYTGGKIMWLREEEPQNYQNHIYF
jgi:xylulokinase